MFGDCARVAGDGGDVDLAVHNGFFGLELGVFEDACEDGEGVDIFLFLLRAGFGVEVESGGEVGW